VTATFKNLDRAQELIKLALSFDSSSSLAQVALARLEGQRVVQQGAATIAIAGGVGGVGVATAVTKNGRASSSSSITTASRRVTMERLANACRDSSGDSSSDNLLCLVYSDDGRKDVYQKHMGCTTILNKVLDSLAWSVQQTIHLARKEIQSKLSWKERSAVKKLGWGACHALSLILSTLECSELDERCLESTQQCLLTLMDCASNLDCVHEKVALVAMSARCAVDLSSSRLPPSFNHHRHQLLALGPNVLDGFEGMPTMTWKPSMVILFYHKN
jgi:hypothetical protein